MRPKPQLVGIGILPAKKAVSATASAVAVGIGLLAGSAAAIQAACDPPIYDVCFHAEEEIGSSEDFVRMPFEFDVLSDKSNQLYEIIWCGLKKLDGLGDPTYEDDSDPGNAGSSIGTLEYEDFWATEGLREDSCESYSVEIYEGHWD